MNFLQTMKIVDIIYCDRNKDEYTELLELLKATGCYPNAENLKIPTDFVAGSELSISVKEISQLFIKDYMAKIFGRHTPDLLLNKFEALKDELPSLECELNTSGFVVLTFKYRNDTWYLPIKTN